MLPDLSNAISSLDVTITPTMLVLALFVSYVVQVIKALVGKWPVLTEEIEDPLWPMISMTLCTVAFGAAGVENYLVAGAILGLSAGGGFSLFKGTTALSTRKPEPIQADWLPSIPAKDVPPMPAVQSLKPPTVENNQ